jgi:hypothetical protein
MTDEAAENSKNSAETIDGEKVAPISPPQESAAEVNSESVDVDKLLDDVSSALGEVNEQMPDSPDAEVDQLLNHLEEDVDSLSQEVEDSVSIPESGSVDEFVEDNPEHVDQEGDISESITTVVTPDEDVDSTLAALIDEIAGVDDESQPEPALDATEPSVLQITPEDEQIAEDEINDVISDIDPVTDIENESSPEVAEDTPAFEQPDAPPESSDDLPEEKAEGTEKTDKTEEVEEVEETSEVNEADESEETEDTEENIEAEETDESDEAPTEAVDADQQTAEVIPDIYSGFSRPLRILVKLLAIVNQPFAFVPDKVKTILGLVALVTCIVTLFTTAMLIIL